MTSSNALLEFYRRHRKQIDIITDNKSLFVLAFIEYLGSITLRELSQKLDWKIDDLEPICTKLQKADMIKIQNDVKLIELLQNGKDLLKTLSSNQPSELVRVILVLTLVARTGWRHSQHLRKGIDTKSTKSITWDLTKKDDKQHILLPPELAEHYYGVPEKMVTMRLHRVPDYDNPAMFEPQLQILPAPTQEPIHLRITFLNGEKRSLTIPKFPGKKNRKIAYSKPCESLSAEAFGEKSWTLKIEFIDRRTRD